jgi:hypothetical protein
MFSNINTQETLLFAKSMKQGFTSEDGVCYPPLSNEEIVDELELIDNMLSVMKSKSLLNKKRNLSKCLDGLISSAVDPGSITPGSSNNHL